MRVLCFRRLPTGVVFSLGLVAIFACSNDDEQQDDNQFREDVISCEEAVARLQRCCADFDPSRVLCNYYYHFDRGCETATTDSVEPALSLAESTCIRGESCDELVAGGVCKRAQDATTYTLHLVTDVDPDGGVDSTEKHAHAPVCP